MWHTVYIYSLLGLLNLESLRTDLNCQPLVIRTIALPIELLPDTQNT